MTRFLSALAFLAWLGLLAAGMIYSMAYDTRPGAEGTVAETRRVPPSGGAELLYFVHPHCPCARGGLKLLAQMDGADLGRIRIVFVVPEGASADWRSGQSWDLARAIPRAEVELDEGGGLAKASGMRTSGHAMFYGVDGRLRFSGGLTGSRGATPARTEGSWNWKSLFADSSDMPVHKPVVGCPQFDEE